MILLPTAYFGPTHYYQVLINNVCSIETKEHFIKQSIRTRCSIYTANGIQNLSIPVIKPNGSKTKIEDVIICDKQNWRKDHWKAIESAYASAPYFDYYGIEIKALIETKETNLLAFNQLLHERILHLLDIFNTPTSFTKDFTADVAFDYRGQLPQMDSKPYIQVLYQPSIFIPNLSILDAIFCDGPMARRWLKDKSHELPSK